MLVYRNADKKWDGPYPFISIDGNTAVVQLPRGRKIFRSVAVKPVTPSKLPAHSEILQQQNLQPNSQHGDQHDSTVLNINLSALNISDSRRKEIEGLLGNSVFEIVRSAIVTPGTRIYGTRWVDTIKM